MDRPDMRFRRACALLLGLFCLGPALAACSPRPAPTAAPPTWTPLAPATPAPGPSARPPWPTAGPTPTAAPALRPAMQTAAFFFYWHNCPVGNCVPQIIYAIPPGWTAPLPHDPDYRDGLYYSALNQHWYELEVHDMHLAGIDIVLPVSWGESPYPWFRTAALQGLVEANQRAGSPLRIGLFDDTTSEISEYSDFLDNQALDGSAYTYQRTPLDLRDPVAGFFFYDRKIKPFFEAIPQEMWATHDGRPVEVGGRPLIVVYMQLNMIHLEYAGQLWANIKASFARDFQDRHGEPITPFVILESSWFSGEALGGNPPVDAVVDGRYTWGTALLGPYWYTHAGYTVASIGVGFDDRKNVNSTNRVRRPDLTVDDQPGGPGAFLESSFAAVPANTDLLLVETWNELYEGTNVCRADYPVIAGQFVPEDFYIGLLRRLLRGQDLWWGAQPLTPTWPAHLECGRSYRLVFPVQNTGARTWSAEEGVHLLVQGDLLPAPYQARPAGPVRPGDVAHFDVLLTAPAQEGDYQVTWQMVSPDGPLGPGGSWTLPAARGAVTTTVHVSLPRSALVAGRPLTLTVALDPPAQAVGISLRLRFDPALLALDGVQPLAGRVGQWRVEVDNDRGEALLLLRTEAGEPLDRLVQLRMVARAAGSGGLWIEQPELYRRDGTLLVLPALWVPFEIAAGTP